MNKWVIWALIYSYVYFAFRNESESVSDGNLNLF